MLHHLTPPVKQLFRGNVLLIICCAFYLAWWMIAFRPVGAVKGVKSGWLLIPAMLAGLASLKMTIEGIGALEGGETLFPVGWVLGAGIAVYFFLLAVTLTAFKRPVTTELILIVGWAMLAMAEVDVLYGSGCLSHRGAAAFLLVILLAAAADLVCYVRYYNLSSSAGYVDGMVPLALAAVIMAWISAAMIV